MGQFSWLYSDTGNQMVNGKHKNSYLLVPPKFQAEYGKYIEESCYDGYGNFGKYDVYELIPIWNKEYIPTFIKRMDEGDVRASVSDKDRDMLLKFYNDKPLDDDYELRYLGIVMACYDEDNEKLPYPIKITESPSNFEWESPSVMDENQGWESLN